LEVQFLTGDEAFAQQAQLTPRFIVGLDLGQAHDYTALAVLGEQPTLAGRSTYTCPHLERFKLDTPYPAIVDAVMNLLSRPEIGGDWLLVADATGVGRPVIDLFKDALGVSRGRLKPVTITGGGNATTGAFGYRAPKRDIVVALRVLLEGGRQRFADGPEVPQLVNEVLNFKVRITDAGNDTYGAWRSGTHDDLVLAVALAAWYAERHPRRTWTGGGV
jgi:hypothetical protein